MGSSRETSSAGSSLLVLENSGSKEDVMDQRKRKRMDSNRVSAQRSRERRRQHLEDLAAQLGRLRSDGQQIAASLRDTTQRLAAVEAHNSVLRAQAGELSNRLESVAGIIEVLNSSPEDYSHLLPQGHLSGMVAGDYTSADGFVMNPWNLPCLSQLPIMASSFASADMFGDY